jgi:outer membrane biosynthesis protein TonB
LVEYWKLIRPLLVPAGLAGLCAFVEAYTRTKNLWHAFEEGLKAAAVAAVLTALALAFPGLAPGIGAGGGALGVADYALSNDPQPTKAVKYVCMVTPVAPNFRAPRGLRGPKKPPASEGPPSPTTPPVTPPKGPPPKGPPTSPPTPPKGQPPQPPKPDVDTPPIPKPPKPPKPDALEAPDAPPKGPKADTPDVAPPKPRQPGPDGKIPLEVVKQPPPAQGQGGGCFVAGTVVVTDAPAELAADGHSAEGGGEPTESPDGWEWPLVIGLVSVGGAWAVWVQQRRKRSRPTAFERDELREDEVLELGSEDELRWGVPLTLDR